MIRHKALTYLQKLKLPGNEEKYERYLQSKRKYAKKSLSEKPEHMRMLRRGRVSGGRSRNFKTSSTKTKNSAEMQRAS